MTARGGASAYFYRPGRCQRPRHRHWARGLVGRRSARGPLSPAGWAARAPQPSREGSIELLRPFVNASDRHFRLLVAWMASALRPVGPYPILALYGEQAAAKSTLARVIRLLIDPQAAPLLTVPRGTRDLMVTGHNGWLLAYDNISVINDQVSDGLCMVSTGGAFAGVRSFPTTNAA